MNNCTICSEVQKWFAQPMRSDGSVLNWFLFVGLVLIAAFVWSRILARIV